MSYCSSGVQFYDRAEYDNAIQYFKKSFIYDDPSAHGKAHFYLGLIYKNPSLIHLYDIVKARDHLIESGRLGYSQAYFRLGLLYEKGRGLLHKNIKKAIKYYECGAALHNADCLLNLGVIYDEPKPGVRQNQAKSFDFFQRASALGDIDAKYNLALMYENGEFVRKDIVKAMKLYCDAGLYPNPEYNRSLDFVKAKDINQCLYSNTSSQSMLKSSNPNNITIDNKKLLQNQIYNYLNKGF